MSGTAVPADVSEHMLDLDDDEDLEVFTKNTSLTDGGPAPGSSSSPDAEEEEEEEEGRPDIFIAVDNPESHVTAIETFIMYRVVTKTTRSDFDSSEFQVRRRYQDFLWLRGRLEETHPTLIVHPLPEKFIMKGMVERFNDGFIETRRKALHRFLNKTAEHPVLTHSPHLKVFLTEQDLSCHRKQTPGFLFRVGETVRAVAKSVRGGRSRPDEFSLMQEYVDELNGKMTSVDKVTQRVIKEHREYLDELRQYGPTYSQWAELEEDLAEPLKGVADCVERCSKETEEQIQHLSHALVPALHEYVLYVETLKAVMRRRDNIQAEFEAKNEAMASRKVEQEELQEEVEALAQRVEEANTALKQDWNRWKNHMRTDLRTALVASTDKNLDYYEKCLAVWESFLLSLRVEPRHQDNGGGAS